MKIVKFFVEVNKQVNRSSDHFTAQFSHSITKLFMLNFLGLSILVGVGWAAFLCVTEFFPISGEWISNFYFVIGILLLFYSPVYILWAIHIWRHTNWHFYHRVEDILHRWLD